MITALTALLVLISLALVDKGDFDDFLE